MTVIFMIHFDAGSIDPSSITPMYKQVAGIISEGIRTGELKVGEKLPSEFELMKDFNVSRVTIRGAISELVTDGLLVRSQGKGTFVAPQKKLQSANDTTGLTDSCRQAGKVLKSQVLSVEYAYPTHADSEFLAVDESQQVIEIKRLRYIDGHPSILETLYFPRKYDFLLHENLEGSVFSILHAHGTTAGGPLKSATHPPMRPDCWKSSVTPPCCCSGITSRTARAIPCLSANSSTIPRT